MSNPSQRRSRVTPKTAGEWGAVVPQWLGIGGLVACFVIWFGTFALTGRGIVEPAFLTAFGGLIVVGQLGEGVAALRSPERTSAPTTDREGEEGTEST